MPRSSRRRLRTVSVLAILVGAAAAAVAGPAGASTGPGSQQPEIVKGGLVQARGAAAIDQLVGKSNGGSPARPSKRGGGGSSIPQNGIYHHGGPVITATKNVYLIWYGDWTGGKAASSIPGAQNLITSFVGSVGGSSYFNINTTYLDGSKQPVTNAVSYVGSFTDAYSQGSALSDAAVQAVVQAAIKDGSLPADPNGVYFVLTSGDVSETSGFLTK